MYDQKLIGILELASPLPGQINGLSMFKILQIKSIFVNAVKHHVDEFENKVEAIMLEEYTAIHPAIRWRFRDAAIALIDRKEVSMSQDIYFEDVYPFYGSLDVRNSSRKQSAAIERDLLFNLQLAHEILNNGYKLLSFDILGELMSTVEARMEKLQKAFSSGDDLATAEFIRKELTPVITHLREQHPQLQLLTNRYMEFAMSETGICTLNRSAYEAALSLVNIAMINCLEDEEKALQKLSPCYFEKFRTDGVEYNIYAGPSISPKAVQRQGARGHRGTGRCSRGWRTGGKSDSKSRQIAGGDHRRRADIEVSADQPGVHAAAGHGLLSSERGAYPGGRGALWRRTTGCDLRATERSQGRDERWVGTDIQARRRNVHPDAPRLGAKLRDGDLFVFLR
jgi:hypothetical protein